MHRLTLDEFEAYEEVIQQVDVGLTLLNLEVPKWIHEQVRVGELHIQRGFDGSGNICEGSVLQDGWAIYYQDDSEGFGLANGLQLDADTLFAGPPGSEFSLSLPGQHRWMSILVPESLLLGTAEARNAARRRRPQLLKARGGEIRWVRSLVRSFLREAKETPALLDCPTATRALESELVLTLRELMGPESTSHSQDSLFWSDRISGRLEEAVHDHHTPLTVRELARSTGVSERTLRRAFQQRYGVSPRRYLLLKRLDRAKRELREKGPEVTTVARVAAAHGFWDFGRFASRYSELFGESPSATLRRSLGS
ncbi:transcriptional regulator EutR [Planctomycetes bacterium MalM25]|nr:transcriptional regulator EutR [Planctomycetes bacterium MalM25]